MGEWELRFSRQDIRELSARYSYADDSSAVAAGRRANLAGKFEYDDFLVACDWKLPRGKSRFRLNSPEQVAERTEAALATATARERIGYLRALYFVNWHVASFLLHIAHTDPYPILSQPTLWALGFDLPPVSSFELWLKYTQVCRAIASAAKVDMRTLDRAMWQFAKKN